MSRPRRGTMDSHLEPPSVNPVPGSIAPLRINKRNSTQQGPAQDASSSRPMPAPIRRPTFPVAAGPASSPLPYPDRPAAERMASGSQPYYNPQKAPYPNMGTPPSQYPDSDSGYTGSVTSPRDSVSSSTPGRHVSVLSSDSYPTPPAFKQRDSYDRPARLRADSRTNASPPAASSSEHVEPNPFPQYHQQYWPPSRMTSTSTTAARRGSPPPPETPISATDEVPPQLQAGVGPDGRRPPHPQHSPLPQSPSSVGSGRSTPRMHGAGKVPTPTHTPPVQTQQQQQPPRRPWTPTESPDSYPHGPPTVWHGTGGQQQKPEANEARRQSQGNAAAEVALEQDFERMNVHDEPPPSYASLSHTSPPTTTAQGYPDEKRTLVVGAATPEVPLTNHPAFHNDPQSPENTRGEGSHQATVQQQQPAQQAAEQAQHPEQVFSPPPAGPGGPPPLPEGWMAHLDPNSGQYYYIHIATSHTQWEPPAMPAVSSPPMSSPPMDAPVGTMSSTTSIANTVATMNTAMGTPVPQVQSPPHGPHAGMTSPGPHHVSGPPHAGMTSPVPQNIVQQTIHHTPAPSFASFTPPPSTPGFDPNGSHTSLPPMPHTPSFPPPQIPASGISVFNIAPANGEYFGPYLRYTNMSIEHGIWFGSLLLATEYQQAPTVHLHMSVDLSPNPRQLKASPIFQHKAWTFYRYDLDIHMGDQAAMWTYAVSTPMGCTRYEFLVAAKHERDWRFISHSCNDFSLSVKGEERARLGGHGLMWKDLMQKHLDCGGFHAQIGVGNQLYADRMWKEIPLLREWLEIRGKENRKNAPWTTKHEEDVTHAYFHYYTSSWDHPHLREALAQIPYMFQLDDHDIFDGFGSYPEHMQFSSMFKNIGRIGMAWYLLFQHHTTLDILHSQSDESRDLFTITGTGWHYIKYLGPAVALVGIDTRSERNQHQVMAGPTYQGLFPKIATLPQSIQHAILLLSVPVAYPRMDTAEHAANAVATGKKAVTGTYNLLGKVVGSAAGIVGAKEVVNSGFQNIKKSVGKAGLMSNVVSVFGEVDVLDDLRDHWTHESKDLERTYLVRTLQGISRQRKIRFTFLSGVVQLCGAGLFHDPNAPGDYKTMYQIITSSIVNAPPPSMVQRMLHSGSNRPLFVPMNGLRTTNAVSDTKEDMIELFTQEPDGRHREWRKLMGRRNYCIFTAFEEGWEGEGKGVKLAVDFMVQGDGVYNGTAKYGPVVVPRVEGY